MTNTDSVPPVPPASSVPSGAAGGTGSGGTDGTAVGPGTPGSAGAVGAVGQTATGKRNARSDEAADGPGATGAVTAGSRKDGTAGAGAGQAGEDVTGPGAEAGEADAAGAADTRALRVRGLTVRFRLPKAEVHAVTDVSFDLTAGQCLALVGESGCGKSVMAAALLGLLPPNALIAGTAELHDEEAALELLGAPEAVLARQVRGRRIGLVPQSPAAHLTPVRTVRAQLEETVRELRAPGRARVRGVAEAVAERASFPLGHLDRYPHELSGGLAQRAAVALALVADPWLILADEPTTGLDRALVERTVDELRRLADAGHAVLMVTHDLAAAERVADRVAVMYAGRLVEIADADGFFGAAGPRHPYARGLLAALPEREFTPIPGMPPELTRLPDGCVFAPRCDRAGPECAVRPAFDADLACHHPLEPADA